MGFLAHLAVQQSVVTASPVKIDFTALAFDDFAEYDITNKRYTPRAGRHVFVLNVGQANILELLQVHIFKDGVLWRRDIKVVAAGETPGLVASDRTDGTHYYEAFVDSTADAAYDILVDNSQTWFESWEV